MPVYIVCVKRPAEPLVLICNEFLVLGGYSGMFCFVKPLLLHRPPVYVVLLSYVCQSSMLDDSRINYLEVGVIICEVTDATIHAQPPSIDFKWKKQEWEKSRQNQMKNTSHARYVNKSSNIS